MTTNEPRLTDDVLRQALTELAAGPDSDLLLTDVLRSVDSQAQVERRPWDTRGWGRSALLIAVAGLLAAGAIGTTVLLSRPQPEPEPTLAPTPLPLSMEMIRVPDFFAPFTYRVPVGMSGKLEVRSAPEGFYLIEEKVNGSGSLVVFFISGLMHGCPSRGSQPTTDDEIAAFLEGLADGPISPTTLGGLPALTAGIDPARGECRDAVFHLPGLNVNSLETQLTLSNPGRLIVGRTGAGTVGVLISAPTEAALSEWLPVAGALMNGFEFDAPALSERVFSVTDFVIPFTYRLPVGMTRKLEAHGAIDRIYFVNERVIGSGKLVVFPISGYVHGCTGDTTLDRQPAAYLEGLRDTAGAGIGPSSTTTLGSLPAVSADVDPTKGTCEHGAIHVDGMGLSHVTYEPPLGDPGRLIIAQSGSSTIGVLISAPTMDKLVGWLPLAQAYVDGLDFEGGQ